MAHDVLKVLTLNIHNYHDFAARKPKIIALIKKYDPDIVALQEIRDDRAHNKEGMDQAQQLNEGLGYLHISFLQTMDRNKIKGITDAPPCFEGIALLSKFPFSTGELPLAQHPQDKHTRKTLVATLDVRGRKVPLFVVHFSPNDLFARLHAEETLARTKNLRPIILGDFNIKYPEEIKKLAEQNNYVSSGDFAYMSYPADKCSYDYIFLPKPLAFARVECSEEPVSDHRALFAEILL